MLLAVAVVTVANEGVVKLVSVPHAVPTLFVAKAFT